MLFENTHQSMIACICTIRKGQSFRSVSVTQSRKRALTFALEQRWITDIDTNTLVVAFQWFR